MECSDNRKRGKRRQIVHIPSLSGVVHETRPGSGKMQSLSKESGSKGRDGEQGVLSHSSDYSHHEQRGRWEAEMGPSWKARVDIRMGQNGAGMKTGWTLRARSTDRTRWDGAESTFWLFLLDDTPLWWTWSQISRVLSKALYHLFLRCFCVYCLIFESLKKIIFKICALKEDCNKTLFSMSWHHYHYIHSLGRWPVLLLELWKLFFIYWAENCFPDHSFSFFPLGKWIQG